MGMLNGYDGITEAKIRAMSHDDLIEAVLRMMKVSEIKCQDWYGAGLIPDQLADAFRGRL